MRVVKVSSKGQIVLPVEVRRRLGLGRGARLELIDEPGAVRLEVVPAVHGRTAAELAGLVTAPLPAPALLSGSPSAPPLALP